MGYHKTSIHKGKLKEFSKIEEEFLELKDATEQNCKILILNELSDLIGAIEQYSNHQFNISLDDLIQMKDLTKRAFESGDRI